MRNLRIPAALAGLVAVYGLAGMPAAKAATSHAYATYVGATCQLSIPTTDTSARPKATGFRNESTTVSNFVICPISSSVTPAGGGNIFIWLYAILTSIDGASHNVTCTAVTGGSGGGNPVYSSKTINVVSGENVFAWNGEDFGATRGSVIPASWMSSVTCLLPPQVLIQRTEAEFDYNIGT